jgi:hypothetical protein
MDGPVGIDESLQPVKVWAPVLLVVDLDTDSQCAGSGELLNRSIASLRGSPSHVPLRVSVQGSPSSSKAIRGLADAIN